MIKILTTWLGGSAIYAWLVIGGVVVAAVSGGAVYVHHKGYESGKADTAAEVAALNDKERARQNAANNAALDAQKETIAKLQSDKDALANIIQENANAADKVPRRDACSVGADGVRRLNRIK